MFGGSYMSKAQTRKTNDPTYVRSYVDTTGPMDSIGKKKKNRIKKPMNSYLFADSLKKINIYSWNIDMSNASIKKMIPMDTTITDFQKNYPFIKQNKVGAAYLGPLGAAAIPLDYFSRSNNYENSFVNSLGEYFYTPENVPFYNGKTPFSQFEYMTSGQRQYAEERFFINHAQNISPASSFDFNYRNDHTKGKYANQNNKNKNLSMNFAHTGRRYTLFAGYINNIAKLQENGGVLNLNDIIDTVIKIEKNINVNLKDANNKINTNNFYFTQAISFPLTSEIDSSTSFARIPNFSLGMSFNYSSYRKVYTDSKAASNNYYDNWYFNNANTRDSISEKNIDAKFFAKYQPYDKYGIIGNITAGAGFSNEKYYNFNPNSYFDPNSTVSKNSVYVYGEIDGGYYQYLRWSAKAKYYPIGYRSQDIEVGGDFKLLFGKKKNPINLLFGAEISSRTPSYWNNHYYSNHYIWNNDFKKEFSTKFHFEFSMPKINLYLGFKQSIEKDKIYYNAKSLPTQASSTVGVTSIYLQKDFKWKGFNFKHRAEVQLSTSQEVVPVPIFSANLMYYYDLTVVKNVLNIHFGFDAYYNTSYYGFGYNPAISQFYNQREYKTGNYPWVDVFAVAKWKRVRVILKMQHINFNITDNLNYISVAKYPMNRRMFTFGFSWSFYD